MGIRSLSPGSSEELSFPSVGSVVEIVFSSGRLIHEGILGLWPLTWPARLCASDNGIWALPRLLRNHTRRIKRTCALEYSTDWYLVTERKGRISGTML